MAKDRDESTKDRTRRAREERLAAALRANLRRRKSGAREWAKSPETPPPETREHPDDQGK